MPPCAGGLRACCDWALVTTSPGAQSTQANAHRARAHTLKTSPAPTLALLSDPALRLAPHHVMVAARCWLPGTWVVVRDPGEMAPAPLWPDSSRCIGPPRAGPMQSSTATPRRGTSSVGLAAAVAVLSFAPCGALPADPVAVRLYSNPVLALAAVVSCRSSIVAVALLLPSAPHNPNSSAGAPLQRSSALQHPSPPASVGGVAPFSEIFDRSGALSGATNLHLAAGSRVGLIEWPCA